MARSIVACKPIIFPACCISCGAVELSGRWFVDMGFDIDDRFDAMPEGVVYMCSICVKDYIRRLMQIVEEQEGGLARVRLNGNATDPVFDGYREQLDRIEQGINSGNPDSVSAEVSSSGLSAAFGG